MNYAQIRAMDISNGEGIGIALFVSGCPFHCKGCFNPETWDYNYGKEFTTDTIMKLTTLLSKPYIQRFSILGGEPLVNDNIDVIKDIIVSFKTLFSAKSIWLYTGYKFEELSTKQLETIHDIDVLVDGQFIEEQKDIQLKFRGSRNQRVIDIQTMRANKDWNNIIIKSGYEKS